MALAKGVNSYVTVAEAEAYFENRLDVAAWTSAVATQKEQSLITATYLLDDLVWVGTALNTAQPLAFPRSGYYYDPKYGTTLTIDGVPDRIVRATFELAHHLLSNDGLLDDTGKISSLSVSGISLTTVIPPSVIPRNVRQIVSPLLAGGGQSNWWRAN